MFIGLFGIAWCFSFFIGAISALYFYYFNLFNSENLTYIYTSFWVKTAWFLSIVTAFGLSIITLSDHVSNPSYKEGIFLAALIIYLCPLALLIITIFPIKLKKLKKE